MKSLELVRYRHEYQEPMIALHRSAKDELVRKGVTIGINEHEEEADLRDIDKVYLQGGGEFLIGLMDGVVMAMGGFQRLSDGSAELRRMRIRKDFQDQGYGSQLLVELERIATASGITSFTFETAKARPLTLEFYHKHGYQENGSGFYGKVETVHFSKTLNNTSLPNQSANSAWYDNVPKVELHLHLEGAIPHDALWELVQKYGGDPSVPNLQALKERFQFRDFPHFIQTWIWKNQFLREYDDFVFIAEAVARDLAQQNIRYAEVFYTPSDFFRRGMETQRLTEVIRSGIARVPEVEIALIADTCRDDGPKNADRILSEINEVKNLGVIGITIGGSEQSYPPEPFAEAYEKARQLGFHTTAHAGEAAGPESVWGAINSLKVERIGHGTRAIEDDALVDYLAEHKIPVEICLISNLRTKVVESAEKHPVRRYFDRGIPISINTDDPKMFGNSLAEEYRMLETKLGFSRDDIRTIILQGIETSWLPEHRKRELNAMFRESPNW